ncbi:uncharacterized protein N0V89_007893 [Didymosphaeria variabile]|uniref:Uncharacterized protein n=1 Tax=Didymosphaeria variabile TaxID=1932322 RepID=A0A9W8XK84_9PLEO|nr:uncharacterized protein N0V89_007893 [Didymosphaeria variabile]KAJ4352544.1 hypothetical protein N0V89_007893 [Didymosphaeria variabile]
MAPQLAQPTIEELDAAKLIAGPFSQFNDSVIFEYLEPPASLNATVLIRATYVNPAVSALNKTGTKHPQSPPLHIHFDQWESFLMAKGKICTTSTYEAKEATHSRGDAVHHIAPYMPHSFHPCADATEDSTMYMWAHPEAVPDPMDRLFFQSLLGFLSDVHEKKASMSILQIMVNQSFQGLIAAVGRWCGYKGLIENYISPEEWQNYLHSKRT